MWAQGRREVYRGRTPTGPLSRGVKPVGTPGLRDFAHGPAMPGESSEWVHRLLRQGL